jgi:hypothetical protein
MSNLPPTNLNYATPVKPGTNLRQIAWQQRALNICILGYICAVVLSFVLPAELKLIAALIGFAAAITGAVFVFMLALSLYGVALGIVLGILALIPLIGLLVLLIVNGKATRVLRAVGVRVGLLGANPNDVPAV